MKKAVVSVKANIIFKATLENKEHERYFQERCSAERFGIDLAVAMKDGLTETIADDVTVEIFNLKTTCEDVAEQVDKK
ncbi:hypothetical protein [Phascolarctobacterium sp.]|uniref:hypothetical protein n=1 Tax=Phascolarctobacterium sp. TaxID=2049039 RepID=UPI00304F0053